MTTIETAAQRAAERIGMNSMPISVERMQEIIASEFAKHGEALERVKDSVSDFVANVKAHKVVGYGDCEVQFDASFKELEQTLTLLTNL